MNWSEILEEKNARIEKLELELEWVYKTLAPPLRLDGNKLPAVRQVRERLAKLLEK